MGHTPGRGQPAATGQTPTNPQNERVSVRVACRLHQPVEKVAPVRGIDINVARVHLLRAVPARQVDDALRERGIRDKQGAETEVRLR